jgi:hypothetical protein
METAQYRGDLTIFLTRLTGISSKPASSILAICAKESDLCSGVMLIFLYLSRILLFGKMNPAAVEQLDR